MLQQVGRRAESCQSCQWLNLCSISGWWRSGRYSTDGGQQQGTSKLHDNASTGLAEIWLRVKEKMEVSVGTRTLRCLVYASGGPPLKQEHVNYVTLLLHALLLSRSVDAIVQVEISSRKPHAVTRRSKHAGPTLLSPKRGSLWFRYISFGPAKSPRFFWTVLRVARARPGPPTNCPVKYHNDGVKRRFPPGQSLALRSHDVLLQGDLWYKVGTGTIIIIIMTAIMTLLLNRQLSTVLVLLLPASFPQISQFHLLL